MKSSKEYRVLAAKDFDKFSSSLLLIYFIYFLISSALSGISITIKTFSFVISIGSIFILPHLSFSLIKISQLVHSNKKPEVENLFDGFKLYGKVLCVSLLSALYIFLWSLLFIIPGIVASYKYSMALHILLDNPNLSSSECLERSKELMNGHKAELFFLHLSYFGWYILCGLTLGILTLWVAPKVSLAQYNFYCDLTSKNTNPNLDNVFVSEDIKQDEFKLE